MNLKLGFVTLFCSFILSEASLATFDCNSIERYPNAFTIPFGKSYKNSFSRQKNLRLMVWNIYKAKRQYLTHDFSMLAKHADLVLFQEAISQNQFLQKIEKGNPEIAWSMAKSFRQSDGTYTGVATGATACPQRERVIFSKAKEPITNTPKTILISEYAIEHANPGRNGASDETLLVANIHGINFVSLKSFESQLNQLYNAVARHQGPIIVAGDFNTWSVGRLEYAQNILKSLGLRAVPVPRRGFFILDHVYTRGLQVRTIHDLTYVKSSDHHPLMVDLLIQ